MAILGGKRTPCGICAGYICVLDINYYGTIPCALVSHIAVLQLSLPLSCLPLASFSPPPLAQVIMANKLLAVARERSLTRRESDCSASGEEGREKVKDLLPCLPMGLVQ